MTTQCKKIKAIRSADCATRCIDSSFLLSLIFWELKPLLDVIKQDGTLCLCFRGKYISVYYKGDSLFKIEKLAKDYKVSFDFNHARYTVNFGEKRKSLENLGYEYVESKNKKRREITCKYPSPSTKAEPPVFWATSVEVLKSLVSDFLDVNKKCDYFSKITKEGKSCHLERQRQQEIKAANNTLDKGYFIYDIEYDQPRNSKDEEKSGRFDMLALRRISEGVYNLVFIELKSTSSACTGNSDIKKHYNDLRRYTSQKALVEIRKNEALMICKYLGAIGMVETKNFSINDVEILFVFTDDAKNYSSKIEDAKERCELSSGDLKLKYNKAVA